MTDNDRLVAFFDLAEKVESFSPRDCRVLVDEHKGVETRKSIQLHGKSGKEYRVVRFAKPEKNGNYALLIENGVEINMLGEQIEDAYEDVRKEHFFDHEAGLN